MSQSVSVSLLFLCTDSVISPKHIAILHQIFVHIVCGHGLLLWHLCDVTYWYRYFWFHE